MEKQVKNALGRPVTKCIQDKQGNIILDVGDLVTYKAIEKVKEAKMLDTLLASVYF